jgi:hypothetical protein
MICRGRAGSALLIQGIAFALLLGLNFLRPSARRRRLGRFLLLSLRHLFLQILIIRIVLAALSVGFRGRGCPRGSLVEKRRGRGR